LNVLNADSENPQDHFLIDKQADAHEFLIRVLDRLNKNVKEMVTGTAKSTIICRKCKAESSKE
jgi:hypothetical protein